MKKPKLVAWTVVIAIMLMGAGYAAWQETLTINSTVSTGELNMQFVEHGIYPFYDNFDNVLLENNYFKVEEFNQDKVNDKVDIAVSGMYPGATFLYDLRADNIGTIPATVESVVIDLSKTEQAFNNTLRVSGAVIHENANGNVKNVLPILDVKLSELQKYLNDGFDYKVLWFQRHYPGMKDWKIAINDIIKFDIPTEEDVPGFREALAEAVPGYAEEGVGNCFIFHMPLSAGNELQSESIGAQEFSFKFNFKQFNK